jgi:C4-dicarboxylate transporter, DctQ subunit
MAKNMKMLTRFLDLVINSLAWIAGAMSIFMMLGVSADVVGRYFLSKPITGMVEANQVMILWIVFLGAAWLARSDGHINMDIILITVRPKVRNIMNLISSIICAASSGVIFWYSMVVIIDLFRRGTIENGNLAINTGYVLLAIPLGCLPLFIQFLRKAYGLGKQIKSPGSSPQPAELETDEAGGK